MKEIWRKIPNWPSYSASTFGRVRLDSYVKWKKTKIGIVIPHSSDKGYLDVQLSESNGIRKSRPVHQLILETFVGPRPLGQETRHLNDVKDDNRLSNLKWGTQKQNYEDKKKHGISSGFASASFQERRVMRSKSGNTMRANGTRLGIASLSRKERIAVSKRRVENMRLRGSNFGSVNPVVRSQALKKAWKTRRKNVRKP